jgi:hypothetical protein
MAPTRSYIVIGSRGTTFRVKLAGKRGRPRKLAVGEKRKQPTAYKISTADVLEKALNVLSRR